MNDKVVLLEPGLQLLYDGDLVEVLEFDRMTVVLRNLRSGAISQVSVTQLLKSAWAATPTGTSESPLGILFAQMTADQRRRHTERVAHVRQVISGYRSGDPDRAGPGEPDPRYTSALSASERYRNKAAELGCSDRTIRRYVADYRAQGEAGLIDKPPGTSSRVDPLWDETARQVIRSLVSKSTMTAAGLILEIEREIERNGKADEVQWPSQATAYRRLAELEKGTNTLNGSAKSRREIDNRPDGPYGRLRAVRPGEYVIMDAQDLDVYAMEPVTHRWVKVVLTVALDLYSRCVVGMRLTPIATRAADVASVMYEMIAGREAPPDWPEEGIWPYHGVPSQLVFTEMPRTTGPVCAPETIVIDHGKAFLSAHVISVCTKMGISIQPAQPRKPTDKPTVERFFKTLREGLIQNLPGYKGPDIYSRGEKVERQAFYFIHELEAIIRQWIACCYHTRKHSGLVIPEWPRQKLSPAEMWGAGIARAGLAGFPATPHLALDFLPVVSRTIQHYGIEIDTMRYNGPFLSGKHKERSPYTGALTGRWPVSINPDDIRYAYMYDSKHDTWHRLEWEHLPLIDTPLCADTAAYGRRLAVALNENISPRAALKNLLNRFGQGAVIGRRERQLAIRQSVENKALAVPDFETETGDDAGSGVIDGEYTVTAPADLTDADGAAVGDDDEDPFTYDEYEELD
ncbi:helix-turn-helix domain-containing protein [Actinoplanes sp. NPDC026670]|uniref:helix-turn-helix domain-containing protein n=1 Tax=Actinoplanes sp. NPDC026670 TaxID=3154700 RepID=UPI0033C1D4E5